MFAVFYGLPFQSLGAHFASTNNVARISLTAVMLKKMFDAVVMVAEI